MNRKSFLYDYSILLFIFFYFRKITQASDFSGGCQIWNIDRLSCDQCFLGYFLTSQGLCVYNSQHCNQVSNRICEIPYCLLEEPIIEQSSLLAHCKECAYPYQKNNRKCQYFCKRTNSFIDSITSCSQEVLPLSNCLVSNCEECLENSQNYCKTCLIGFTQISGNCIEISCKDGFYLTEDYQCLPCEKGCAKCTSRVSCQLQKLNQLIESPRNTLENVCSDTSSMCDRKCFERQQNLIDNLSIKQMDFSLVLNQGTQESNSGEYYKLQMTFLNNQNIEIFNNDIPQNNYCLTLIITTNLGQQIVNQGLNFIGQQQQVTVESDSFPLVSLPRYVVVSLKKSKTMQYLRIIELEQSKEANLGIVLNYSNFSSLNTAKQQPVCEDCNIPEDQIVPSEFTLICLEQQQCESRKIAFLKQRVGLYLVMFKITVENVYQEQQELIMHSIKYKESNGSTTEESFGEYLTLRDYKFEIQEVTSLKDGKIEAFVTVYLEEYIKGEIIINMWSLLLGKKGVKDEEVGSEIGQNNNDIFMNIYYTQVKIEMNMSEEEIQDTKITLILEFIGVGCIFCVISFGLWSLCRSLKRQRKQRQILMMIKHFEDLQAKAKINQNMSPRTSEDNKDNKCNGNGNSENEGDIESGVEFQYFEQHIIQTPRLINNQNSLSGK